MEQIKDLNGVTSRGKLYSDVVIAEDAVITTSVIVEPNTTFEIGRVLVTDNGGNSFVDAHIKEHDSAATYAVGDKVVYNGNVEECNTAIAVPEAFADAKWDTVSAYEANGILTRTIVNDTAEEINVSAAVLASGVIFKPASLHSVMRNSLFKNKIFIQD